MHNVCGKSDCCRDADLLPVLLQLDADDMESHLEEKEGQDEYSQLQMPV